MPPKWPRKPDRNDPAYRKLEDRINFAVHVAATLGVNSVLWFLHELRPGTLPWVKTFTLVWVVSLVLHAVYVFAIASYEPAAKDQS
ncbi:MAG: 2TM domain-containing protein [Cyanobacteria bacterium P01_A01_bin.105]